MLAAVLVLALGRGGGAHPLDPLSAGEIQAAVGVLRSGGLVDGDTRFALIDLDEPAKVAVLGWRPEAPIGRAAFVVARKARTVYEGVVDLTAGRVRRWQAVPGVQTAILADEIERAQRIAAADAGWRAALQKRGYGAPEQVHCAPLTVGYTGAADSGRRLLKLVCFDTTGGADNLWSRPIEGLAAVVDLDEGRVIRVVDTGAVPVSRDPASFIGAGGAVAAPTLPTGDVTVAGSEVHWGNWSFHFRLDPRAGPVVSLVRFRDGATDRLVLYRGSVAELFVPYMAPDNSWSSRSFLDVGEYGFGTLASPLSPGVDCPADARFLDAVLADDDGAPVLVKSRLCLFARDTGAPLWRHAEMANQTVAGRPTRELVLRTIPSVGNYDYVIDWVLTAAGTIRIDVGATGIDAVREVKARSMADPGASAETAYGALVAPGLSAIDHDHFLSLRLDVDIDGAGNTLMRQKLVRQRLDAGGLRRTVWRAVDLPVTEEGPIPDAPHGTAELWRIVNPNRTNALGQHPGYELRPGHSTVSLLSPDDIAQRRGAFSAAPLWVTAYGPRELYAAGDYPNQSRGDDGLPAYVARHRPVANADIVLWCTMGFHHVTRPEDWPVMSTVWHSVSLVPDGFFDRNPTIEGTRPMPPAK